MAIPKYMCYSLVEAERFINKATSMEEVLEQMQYSNARDKRFIAGVRDYYEKTLKIDTSHLPDCRNTIKCNCCKEYKTLDNYYFSKGKLSQKVCKDCVRQKDKELYFYSEEELNNWKAISTGKADILRAKGLGELNAEDLQKVCFLNERYKRITISDAAATTELLNVLQGPQVEPRKKYIYNNATELGFEFD